MSTFKLNASKRALKMNALTTHNTCVRVADFIEGVQLENGAIPWFKQGKLDPWDHCEAIMALSINGRVEKAKAGLHWLRKNQNEDGSWYSKYFGDLHDGDLDRFKKETNFAAYPSTALWHWFICSQDKQNLAEFFPMLKAAINFVVSLQNDEGDIQWAISDKESLPKDALITACSSILRSLECAINIADVLDQPYQDWLPAQQKLAHALKNAPWRFDRTWESKARFSMDWFYPILSGIYTPAEAELRIEQSWEKFIIPNYGCRCVSDEPWVTVAESCELVMALLAADKPTQALELYSQLQQWQSEEGAYWTGYVVRDQAIWPEEKTTWTAAAIALAGDALFQLSPASHLFTRASGLFFSEHT